MRFLRNCSVLLRIFEPRTQQEGAEQFALCKFRLELHGLAANGRGEVISHPDPQPAF